VTCSSVLERVGRDGTLRLRFDRQATRTVLTSCRSTVPLQVLAPIALDDPAAVVSVLNPTGGLVGGDRLSIDVVTGPGAHACLTTPSATRVYRTTGPAAEQQVTLRLGPGAALEWVPDHTIPFPGSAFQQAIHVDLGDGARLILVDAFATGRVARGEAWTFRSLDSLLSARDGQRWRVRDRLCLRGGEEWAGLGRAEHHAYFGTVVVLGARPTTDLGALITARVGERTDVRVGAGALSGGGWIVRVLAASAMALTEALAEVWTLSRRLLLDLGPLPLRKL
jgi:urease accessory protein